MAFTYDGSGNASGITLYLNGSAIADDDDSDTLAGNSITNALDFQIGAYDDAGPFNGILESSCLIAGELVAAWIKAEYNSGNNSLVSYGAEEEAPAATARYDAFVIF